MTTFYKIKNQENSIQNKTITLFNHLFFIIATVLWISEAVAADKILEMSKTASAHFRLMSSYSLKATSLPKWSLTPVDCSKENVIGGTVGIRPEGKNGIRLEKEIHGDKVIFHNTSHGGAGATLAPGCARRIVEMFEGYQEKQNTKVCVIGAGHIGLMTALELRRKGYEVTVLAEQFPTKAQFTFDERNPPMTSLIYGGLWLPYKVNIPSEKKDIVEKIIIDSYDYYADKIDPKNKNEPLYQGLSYRYAYAFPNRDELSTLPQYIRKKMEIESGEVEFGNGKYFPATRYKTIAMDADKLVNHLFNMIKNDKKIEQREHKFSDRQEFLKLEYKYIFNCTGYGSRALFDDKNINPYLGKLLYLKREGNINAKIDYFMSGKVGEHSVTVYPLYDKIAVGLTREEGEALTLSEDDIESLRHNLESFLKDKISSKSQQDRNALNGSSQEQAPTTTHGGTRETTSTTTNRPNVRIRAILGHLQK